MNWWRRLWFRKRMDEQLEKELNFHLEQHAADLMASGMVPDEARRQARIALGGATQVTEECRDARGTRWLEDLVQDFRYGMRVLWQRPGFSAVSVLTLALGIGATTAIFSAVNPILFESLPYPQANRIMMVWEMRSNGRAQQPAFGTFYGLAERSRSFEALAAMKPWQPTMTGPAQPERFEGQCVSANYFRVLGIAPLLGRDFESSDDRPAAARVAVLSYQLWQRRFGGEKSIVGHQVTLDDNLYTVIGVMPNRFENVLAPAAELWSPLQYDLSQGRAWGHHLRIAGRLRPGVNAEQARRELDVSMQEVAQIYATGFATSGGPPRATIVTALQQDLTESVKPGLLAILGAVVLVLLIACVNVTNLLVARGVQRRGEFAMRAALGAGRGRLVRQLLTESLFLAAMGSAVGILVAMAGVRALVALSPPGLPRVNAIGVDGAAFVFALIITTIVGLVVGLAPALHASRRDLHTGMQQGSRRTAGGQQWTRRTLVITEVALAMVLLVSAGLLLRSLNRLFSVAPGFDATHLLTMQVQVSGHRFDDDATRHRFFAQALEAVRQVPGVSVAGFTSQLPLSGDFDVYGVKLERGVNSSLEQFGALRYAVTPGYCEAMHIPLLRGRLLSEHDAGGAPLVALVSESFMRHEFGAQDPLGHRMHIGPGEQWYTIVGVVGDVKQTSLALSQLDAIYLPSTQRHWADEVMSLAVRTRGDVAAIVPALQSAIWSVDKDQPIVRIATMDSLLATSEAERRFALILFEAFALAALVLAAIGIYGVLSGSVTERMRELGVRSALGASRRDILALVLKQGMALTALGVVIGLAGAIIASQSLITLLFGISRLDAITYFGVAALLAGVSMAACWVPAWRASRVDPSITLRAE
jgi:putative ABC transport system permease protein